MAANIIVLSFDTLPLSLLGCYGNEWVVTPHFDQLAWEGVTFDNCFATDISSDGRRLAWWTGRTNGFDATEESEAQFQFLYRFLEKIPVGLEIKSDEAPATPKRKPARLSRRSRPSPFERLLQQGLASAREMTHRGKSSLLWLHSNGVSEPFDPPREYLELYLDEAEDLPDDPKSLELIHAAAAVSHLDHLFGHFRPQFEDVYAGKEITWILTAAASRPVGFEPGEETAASRAAEGYIHTPLIVSSASAGSRRQQLVQTADLLPTLCDVLKVRWSAPMDGKSLAPLLNDASVPWREHVVIRELGRPVAVRTRSELLVCRSPRAAKKPLRFSEDDFGTDVLLFRKPDDRWEQQDVSRMEPDLTATLLQQIFPSSD